jgi:hypothetical protein
MSAHGSMVEPLDSEYCPTCGQLRPTGFATGTRSVCPDPSVRQADDVPDPDGPEGYEVVTRLARGEGVHAIARSMDLTLAQVEGLKPYIGTARNVKRGLRR